MTVLKEFITGECPKGNIVRPVGQYIDILGAKEGIGDYVEQLGGDTNALCAAVLYVIIANIFITAQQMLLGDDSPVGTGYHHPFCWTTKMKQLRRSGLSDDAIVTGVALLLEHGFIGVNTVEGTNGAEYYYYPLFTKEGK